MTSWGFDPLNIDELWNALLFGSCTKQMRPLNIMPNDDISPEGKIQSGKHLAFLTRLFIMIGFLDVTDMQGRSRINLDGMEFPHSFSDVYPKRMLKDCVSSGKWFVTLDFLLFHHYYASTYTFGLIHFLRI